MASVWYNSLLNCFYRLSNIGIDRSMNHLERRPIRLSNILAMSVALLCILSYVLAIPFLNRMQSIDQNKFLWSSITSTAIVLFVLFFNWRHWYFLARIHIIICACLGSLTGLIIHGADAGAHVPLIPTVICAFMLFTSREKKKLCLAVFLPTFTFFIHMLVPHLSTSESGHAHVLSTYTLLASSTAFLAATFAAWYYFKGIWEAIDTREDALKRLQEKQQILIGNERNIAFGQMAASVAHEINNPLAIIDAAVRRLQIELQSESISKEAVTKYSGIANKSIIRITAIVKSMRIIARDGQNDPFVRASVKEIIDDSLNFCRERFKARGIDLEIENPPIIFIACRPCQIAQILINLLNNSYDAIFKHDDKKVKIAFRQSEGFIEFLVSDSGPGISPDLQEKIFQPFFTTKTLNKGTGLGLSLSRSIALDHGGNLLFAPEEKCTTFVLKIPISQ